ncbi:hypothetical protein DPV78_003947 [Talaromyces pinophilus]|nr:hypothetical protein DPV78_003947 [Talaromyces pinophilus]
MPKCPVMVMNIDASAHALRGESRPLSSLTTALASSFQAVKQKISTTSRNLDHIIGFSWSQKCKYAFSRSPTTAAANFVMH